MQERVASLGQESLARIRSAWQLHASGRVALLALAVAVAYYAGAQVGFLLQFPQSPISIIWPPNAILLAVLLLLPSRQWWVVLLGALPAHVLVEAQNGVPPATLLGLYLTNCGEPLLGAAGVRRLITGPPWFSTVRQVATYVGWAALFAPFVTSFLDTGVIVLTGWESSQHYWLLWQERFVSNALSYLTVSPVLIIGACDGWHRLRTASRQRHLEAALLALCVLGAAFLVFRTPIGESGSIPALLYVPVPILLWAAFRFGVGGSSAALLGMTVLAATSQAEVAVLETSSLADGVLALQVFLIAVSAPTLLLGALGQERRQATRELRESEERYRTAVRHLPGGAATIFDADLRFLLADGPALVHAREQLAGKTIFDALMPQSCAVLEPLMRAAIEGRGSASELELAGRWYDLQFLPIRSGGRPLGLSIAFDVTERRRTEEALRASEARYRDLVETQTDMICRYLPSGELTFVNDAYCRYFGRPREQLLGTEFFTLLPPADAERAQAGLRQFMQHPGLVSDEHEVVLPDGNRGWQHWVEHPILDDAGCVVEIQAIGRDITERKRAEEALRELEVHRQTEAALRESEDRLRHANAELEEASRLKSEFLATISHEFRTPLTLLLGPLQELLAAQPDRLPPEGREQLETAHRSGLRLLRLVNALLDFSRLEAGRLQPTYRPTDLAAYTAELAGVFRSAAEHAGLRLVVDCPPLPEPVYVDRDLWEKVVLNLVSNALKFTFAGEIAVTLRAQGGRVVLAVRDTGTGIPPEELPHLFERFHRVRGAQARIHEGTGIGLALVYELVRLHGGTVEVTSAVGAGSTFTVAIPRGTAHLPADHIERAGDAPSVAEEARRWLPNGPYPLPRDVWRGEPDDADRPARLLVVDDNADMRAYLMRLLRGRGVVEAVGDGATALEVARTWMPDLILADVMMPGLDGFALLQAVRADPRTRSMSVILLSAQAGDEARVEGLRAGADDYLVKPMSAAELLARVDGQLALVHLRGEARASEERRRLARDLHDSAVQSLYSVTLVAYGVRRAFETGNGEQIKENLDLLDEAVRQTMGEMRLLVYQLRPDVLALEGLVHALKRRLDAVERRAGVAARLVVEGEIALPSAVVEAFYYIAQEALSNALKHAAASEVTVRLAFTDDTATLSVSDNGGGFDLAALPGGGGLGLVSMRERAERVGASFAIEPAPARGTRVTVERRLRGDS